MPTITEINSLRRERKTILDVAGQILYRATDAGRNLTGEEEQEFERRHEKADKLLTKIRQLEHQTAVSLGYRDQQEREEATRMGGREDFGGLGRNLLFGQRQEIRENEFTPGQKDCTLRWLLGGWEALTPEERSAYARPAQRGVEQVSEIRALSGVTGNLGAYTIPQGFVYKLEVALKYYGGILEAADYIDTDMGNLLPWPSINDTTNTGETISENTQVAGSSGGAAEQDPAYGVVNFSAYMHDSGLVPIPLQLMQDSAFDIERYLIGGEDGLLAIRIGRRLNNLCTVGTGSNQETGVLTAATVGTTASLSTGITYNNLLDLEHSVDPAYRRQGGNGTSRGQARAAWMFSDATFKAIKKLTDNNGRPLFLAGGVSEGPVGGYPDTIDGFPFYINQDFPAIASLSTPVAFGDFKKYKIRRVKELQMVRLNERLIDKLQLGFLAWQRFDGNLLDAGTHPIKTLQMSAT